MIHKTSSVLRRAFGKLSRGFGRIEARTAPQSASKAKTPSFLDIYDKGPGRWIVPIKASEPKVDRAPNLTLIIPGLGPSSFFGGIATALIFSGVLALRLGRRLRIVQTSLDGDGSPVPALFKMHGIDYDSEIEVLSFIDRKQDTTLTLDVNPDDIFVASAWWDARILLDLKLQNKFVYLLQDFEPIFYPNSDMYVMAESTYRSERYIPVCNTKLMLEFMSSRYPYIAQEATFFEPAVSYRKHGLVKPSAKKTLFVYGRPGVERNLFYSAFVALESVFADGRLDGTDWQVFMAGDSGIPDMTLSSGHFVKNLGKLSLDEYRNFMQTVDLAISPMMAPHPNYPTLEFCTVGAAVVTTQYANKVDLSSYSRNIFVADLTHEDIAAKIVEASGLTYDERIRNAEDSTVPSDWNATLSTAIERVASQFRAEA